MPCDPPFLIVHVIHHLVTGGMENGLVNLVNRLPAGEFRHAIVCIEDSNDFRRRIQREDVEVIELRRSVVGARGVRSRLYRTFRDMRPAIVHSRNQSGLDALLPAYLAGVKCRIHGEHGWDVDNLDGRKFKPALLKRLHSPLVTRYVTVSQDLKRHLQQRIGVRADRIEPICNGVDVERFQPATERPGGLLPEGFAAPDSLVIGTVGRLQPVKNQGALLLAAAQVLARRPEWRRRLRMVLVGDGPMREKLAAQVKALDLGDIVLLPGASHHVREWLQAFDVFALPSLNEGISNTILEAMATGLPVIASGVGGNLELVERGVCGEFHEATDIAALAACIAAYADDDALRQRHGQAARRLACERFSLERMVSRYRDLYRGELRRTGLAPSWASAQP